MQLWIMRTLNNIAEKLLQPIKIRCWYSKHHPYQRLHCTDQLFQFENPASVLLLDSSHLCYPQISAPIQHSPHAIVKVSPATPMAHAKCVSWCDCGFYKEPLPCSPRGPSWFTSINHVSPSPFSTSRKVVSRAFPSVGSCDDGTNSCRKVWRKASFRTQDPYLTQLTWAFGMEWTRIVPSNEMSSSVICLPFRTRVERCEIHIGLLSFSQTSANVMAQFGLHTMRGQTSTVCPLYTSCFGSLITAPACPSRCTQLYCITTVLQYYQQGTSSTK